MRFLYPLGLLGLIGIPILIIIYIIKNKYTEQTVASTYIWTLSERFLKRKNPINRITGIISLILQILAVAVMSVSIAHPVIVLENEAFEYCFILDASGSMQISYEGKTRMDRGKAEIVSVIENAVDGSAYTLVYVGETTTTLYERLEDKKQAIALLQETEPSCAKTDFTDAVSVAQSYFDANPALKTYLVTDKTYERNDNVIMINVSDGTENYAVSDVTYTLDKGVLTVEGNVTSYENDAELTVELYIDDGAEKVADQTLTIKKTETLPFTFTYETEDFQSLKVALANTDALSADNQEIVFNLENENSYDALIVSDQPFFIRSVFEAVGNAKVTVVETKKYVPTSGYDLYVFDCYNPGVMPKDGAVWFFNLDESLPETGFSKQGEITLDQAEPLTLSTSSATMVKKLTANMSGEDIKIKKYMKYGVSRNFTTLLSYKGQPIVFIGTNTYGNREVVFAFDLHDSNFPMLVDYVVLSHNLLDYSFPAVLDDVSYYCGETLTVDLLSNTQSVRVESPSNRISYLDTSGTTAEMTLDEVGVYTITLAVGDETKRFYVYSAMPLTERIPVTQEREWSLQGEAGANTLDGKYDNLAILLVCLAVVFLTDWVVYCYDKYQLR